MSSEFEHSPPVFLSPGRKLFIAAAFILVTGSALGGVYFILKWLAGL